MQWKQGPCTEAGTALWRYTIGFCMIVISMLMYFILHYAGGGGIVYFFMGLGQYYDGHAWHMGCAKEP